jgi:hypothetical protein
LFGDVDDVFGHGPDPLGGGGCVVAAASASPVSVDGVGGDEALVDGVVEHHGQHGADAGDSRCGKPSPELFPPFDEVE